MRKKRKFSQTAEDFFPHLLSAKKSGKIFFSFSFPPSGLVEKTFLFFVVVVFSGVDDFLLLILLIIEFLDFKKTLKATAKRTRATPSTTTRLFSLLLLWEFSYKKISYEFFKSDAKSGRKRLKIFFFHD